MKWLVPRTERGGHSFGLVEAFTREICGAVGREAAAAGAGDEDRMAEVRKRMLAAAG